MIGTVDGNTKLSTFKSFGLASPSGYIVALGFATIGAIGCITGGGSSAAVKGGS